MPRETLSYPDVIKREDAYLRERREALHGRDFAEQLDDNRFGIALSGGGIRSAVINLGILKTLNKFGILEQADYLSSVSGGGYTGSYVQATLRENKDLQALFAEEHIDYMRRRGEYLFPGTGWYKLWNQFTLVVAYLVSWIMSMLSPLVLVALLVGGLFYIDYNELVSFVPDPTAKNALLTYGLYGLAAVLLVHYIVNITLVYRLDASFWFERTEAALVGLGLLSFAVPFALGMRVHRSPDVDQWLLLFTVVVVLVLLGFFTNPNATSFHRYYRKQLADAFLHFAGSSRNALLTQLLGSREMGAKSYLAPYPLINTCLNLQSSSDPNFQGAKASDYFLLSPLHCGAKLVGYVPTAQSAGYNRMTLPAAVTISAAAINPGLGAYSNKLFSVVLTLLNLRLGFWVPNPEKLTVSPPLVWWPFYFFYELLGRIGTDKKMVNISDGGHIENLGVMELLRRRCKLIIAVDAGADPAYIFSDLENLTIRARNELGIDIRFRPGQIPEEVLRVNPSHGYSRQRFAVADLMQLWEKKMVDGEEVVEHFPAGRKIGSFVYVKSSVTAPQGKPDLSREDPLKYGTYKYKIYHPAFPHESTADQFFDPIQWEAYFQLGQFIAADILGCDDLNQFDVDQALNIPIDLLLEHFDHGVQLFGSMPVAGTGHREVPSMPELTEERSASAPPVNYEM